MEDINKAKMAGTNNDIKAKTTDSGKGSDNNSKKMADGGDTKSKSLAPYTTKIAGYDVTRGDMKSVDKALTDAKAKGGFNVGKQFHAWGSPEAKGLVAQFQAVGDGGSQQLASKVGKMTTAQSENIAKGKAIAANMGSNQPATTNRAPAMSGAR